MPSQSTTSPNDEFSSSVPSKLAMITDRRVVKTAEKIINELNFFSNLNTTIVYLSHDT